MGHVQNLFFSSDMSLEALFGLLFKALKWQNLENFLPAESKPFGDKELNTERKNNKQTKKNKKQKRTKKQKNLIVI